MVSRVRASLRTDTARMGRSIRAALRGRTRAMEQAVNARRERSEPLHPGWRAVRYAPNPPDSSRRFRLSGSPLPTRGGGVGREIESLIMSSVEEAKRVLRVEAEAILG